MRRDRAAFVRAVAGLLTVVLVVGLPGPASAGPTGALSGIVTGLDGTPVRSVDVTAYSVINGQWTQADEVSTADDGSYHFFALPVGRYRVEFGAVTGRYLAEYWDDAATFDAAADIVVDDGQTTSGIDAQLAGGGHISGVVTNIDDEPIAYSEVQAFLQTGPHSWYVAGRDTTSSDGTYDIGLLPSGTYRLRIAASWNGYRSEYWPDTVDFDAAIAFPVVDGEAVTHRDAQLARLGRIRGLVNSTDGKPLEGIKVNLYQWSGSTASWQLREDTTSRDSGYGFSELPAGRYKVQFEDDDELYQTEYWDNASDLATASDINVEVDAAPVRADAELIERGHISGTVTDVAGKPIDNVFVSAYRKSTGTDGDHWSYTRRNLTASDGSYDIGSLPTGTYRLEFNDYRNGHLSEFWDNKLDIASATDISVVAGQTSGHRDAALIQGGRIRGTVTGRGHPVIAIDVWLYRWSRPRQSWEAIAGIRTDAAGAYEFDGLTADTYRVGFDDATHYVYESTWWGSASSVDDARDIAVVTDQVMSGIDVDLDAFPDSGGSITGTLTGPDSAFARVTPYRAVPGGSGWQVFRSVEADKDGNYFVDRLPAGNYRLHFWPDSPSGVDEYWDDSPTFDGATDIAVSDQNVVVGVDAYLESTASPGIYNTDPPAIIGQARVGHTLVTSPGSWSPSTGVTYSYEWFTMDQDLNDLRVAGGPTGSYVPVAGDAGRLLMVVVRASKPGYRSSSAESQLYAIEPAHTLAPTLLPVFDTPRVGVTIRATPGLWSPTPEAVTYEWLIDGQPVVRTNISSYTPVPRDVGKRLQVRVTASASGYDPSTITSKTVTIMPGALRQVSEPKVTGKVKKNGTLTVSPGTWSPRATSKIQWYAAAKAIPKATTTKLRLAGKTLKTVAGKAISVVVTASAPGYKTVVTRLKVAGRV